MNDLDSLALEASDVSDNAARLSEKAISLAESILNVQTVTEQTIIHGVDPFVYAITIFVLACFVGYFVAWKVTPALHTPLMSVTNAISSIIVVGALIAATATSELSNQLGNAAIILASINIFGGFIVTQRMLHMFKKK